MEIKINGKPADIKADSEKTIGEIMAALEGWLVNSGHRLSGLAIDGQEIDSSSLAKAFAEEIDNVKVLDISTTSIAQLAAASLLNLLADVEEFEGISFDKRNDFYQNWKERPQSLFMAEQMPDLMEIFVSTFITGALEAGVLRSITEERLREVEAPVHEIKSLENILEETCLSLVDLPLDIQTGKDAKAARTIQVFTGLTEKIFRVLNQLNLQGYIKNRDVYDIISRLINDFNVPARELVQAYENNDTVLIGDLAEYEMAPRLREIYNAITGGIDAGAGAA
jgi:hypothetical protein